MFLNVKIFLIFRVFNFGSLKRYLLSVSGPDIVQDLPAQLTSEEEERSLKREYSIKHQKN